MSKRTYDHRVRNAIAKSGNPSIFPELNISRTKAQQWIRESEKEIVTTHQLTKTESEMVIELENLKRELAQAKTKLALMSVALMVSGFRLQYIRIASADLKEELLDAVAKKIAVLSLKGALETIGLSMARYRSWSKREIQCRLSDEVSCPKLTPTKITTKDRRIIGSLVTSKKYLHFSIPSLALFAIRRGLVFASLTVWYCTVREFSLRRPGIRVYPDKPKIGIRAAAPNQIWHLDQSILRLKNGTKVFIRAVVDNFSRCVLSWQVTDGSSCCRWTISSASKNTSANSLKTTTLSYLILHIMVPRRWKCTLAAGCLRKRTNSNTQKSRPERRDGSRICPLPADSVLLDGAASCRLGIRATHCDCQPEFHFHVISNVQTNS
jgi:hypothetical protein